MTQPPPSVTIGVAAGANDAADRRRDAALNDVILPQVARVMAGSAVSAIERRIGQSGSAARSLAIGQLWEVGASRFRLKGEAMRSELEVKGAAGVAKVDAAACGPLWKGVIRARWRLAGLFESSLEVGVRYDGGDGETGSGAEIGGRLGYRNPGHEGNR